MLPILSNFRMINDTKSLFLYNIHYFWNVRKWWEWFTDTSEKKYEWTDVRKPDIVIRHYKLTKYSHNGPMESEWTTVSDSLAALLTVNTLYVGKAINTLFIVFSQKEESLEVFEVLKIISFVCKRNIKRLKSTLQTRYLPHLSAWRIIRQLKTSSIIRGCSEISITGSTDSDVIFFFFLTHLKNE